MRKFGIAAKLYLAFGGMFLLAITASLVGWQGFQRISDSQTSVIDQAIPGLRQAHRLSEFNASIGAAEQRLLRSYSEREREQASTILFAHVEALNALLNELERSGIAETTVNSLRNTVGEIAVKLREQDILVKRRLQQQMHFSALVSQLESATDELNELADSLVANAAATTTAVTSSLYDLVEDNASQQELYSVFDRLVEVDLDAMERMYELRLRSANLRAFFNQVRKESEPQVLARLRQRTKETLSILKRRVSEINDPQRRQQAEQLLAAMEVDSGPLYIYGVFKTRASLLDIDASLARLAEETGKASQRLNDSVNALNQSGGDLINRVSTVAKESLDSSRRLFNWISIFSLLVVALILWGFIKRDVIRRLLSLESATRAIAAGDYDVDIVDEGRDELAHMGKALRGFRNNAIEKKKVDEELRQHKAHLEELVEQRTEQLREANEKLFEEAQNHAVAREKAEQANQAKTAFLATMSHELRTPLSGALGTLHLLEDTPLDARQRNYAHTIEVASTTLLDIVNDILGYSQMEAGKLVLEDRQFALSELLRDVVDLMAVSASEKGNSLHLDCTSPANFDLLRGDSGKLHQVLLNLIGNANKFTDDGSITVSVTTEPEDDAGLVKVKCLVKDTGIGIAADKHEEIFQAFAQVDASSARKYGGIGLGLAICERLVGVMGGTISLQSEPGKGTCIGFDVAMARAENQPESIGNRIGAHSTVDNLNVLLVEDDETNRMVASNYLRKLGHSAVLAGAGERALELLNSKTFSLVLLDISLPGIDGVAILQHIRAHGDRHVSELPVIAMSAHVFTEEVDSYLSAGMNGFLGKPYTLEDLERAIAQVLGSESLPLPERVNIADVIFDSSVVDSDIAEIGAAQVQSISDSFLSSCRELHAQIAQAIDADNIDDVAEHAHRLRGAAGNFGLNQLCARLADIEKLARAGTCIPSEVQTQLGDEFEESVAALEGHLAKYKAGARKTG